MTHTDYTSPKRFTPPKLWRCPLCGATVTTRGAAGHLSMMHDIKWKQEYLKSPQRIINDDTYIFNGLPNEFISNYFSGIDYRSNGDARSAIYNASKITSLLRQSIITGDWYIISVIKDSLVKAKSEVDTQISDRRDKSEDIKRMY